MLVLPVRDTTELIQRSPQDYAERFHIVTRQDTNRHSIVTL